jgi:hypothetical protein
LLAALADYPHFFSSYLSIYSYFFQCVFLTSFTM